MEPNHPVENEKHCSPESSRKNSGKIWERRECPLTYKK
jgi:hypothetical protein